MTTPAIVKPFSECRITLFREPYVYGYIDDFLPEETYRRLAASFLDPGDTGNSEVLKYGKKRILFLAPPVPDDIPFNQEWKELVAAISSPGYIADCYNWIRDNYNHELHPDETYAKMTEERFKMEAADLRMQCEFSSLDGGTFLAPHSDSPDKFMSCILYFAPDEWRSEYGGGTSVFVPKDSSCQKNWNNRFLTADDVTTAFTCDFVPNRLFFFIKNHNSWHGLSPVTAPEGMQRRSFNFSLQCDRKHLENSSAAPYLETIRRQEGRTHFFSRIRRFFKRA